MWPVANLHPHYWWGEGGGVSTSSTDITSLGEMFSSGSTDSQHQLQQNTHRTAHKCHFGADGSHYSLHLEISACSPKPVLLLCACFHLDLSLFPPFYLWSAVFFSPSSFVEANPHFSPLYHNFAAAKSSKKPASNEQ